MTKMRMRQAVIQALNDELERDPAVILMGEDIGAAGGAFKATEGLYDKFGPSRVLDTPISETGFLGAAVGAAATGLRPVAEIMFIEFVGVALDQITTEAASLRYLSRGKLHVPLTVRAAAGAGLGFGCQHSQMLEGWFRGTAGLSVVVPSGGQSAYGLLRSAIQNDDPVIVLESKTLYGNREDVDATDDALIPIGVAQVVRSGSDVTIVGLGQTTGIALDAATTAVGSFDADVIDLLSIAPWDHETVLRSVARTKRLVTVEESPVTGGWGSELCATVTAELWGDLAAPPLRICTPDVPVPYAAGLERQFLPNAAYVLEQIAQLMGTGRVPAPWWMSGTAS